MQVSVKISGIGNHKDVINDLAKFIYTIKQGIKDHSGLNEIHKPVYSVLSAEIHFTPEKIETDKEAKFTEFSNKSQWVTGFCDGYNFEAKLFDVGSPFGIKKGRVSKLHIYNEDKDIVRYDRGWDGKIAKEHRPIYNKVMKLLENSPKRFESENPNDPQ